MLLSATGISATEESTKVSICQSEQCDVPEDSVTQMLHDTRHRLAELSHSNITVLNNYDQFSQLVNHAYHKEKSITASEVDQICAAVLFAADKHRLQTRKNKEKTPYISHPIGVAYNVMSFGEVRDSAIIIGALLHDTVEDTQTTFEELKEKFGDTVTGYIKEVTDDKSLGRQERKRLQVINAPHKSKGATMIKLADKLYNVNDLISSTPADWSQSRVDNYLQWAQSVVDRLPRVNPKMSEAVDTAINSYWEKQENKKA